MGRLLTTHPHSPWRDVKENERFTEIQTSFLACSGILLLFLIIYTWPEVSHRNNVLKCKQYRVNVSGGGGGGGERCDMEWLVYLKDSEYAPTVILMAMA